MKTTITWPNLALRTLLCTTLFACTETFQLNAQTSSLAQAGLRTAATQGQFNAVQSDAAGNLYLLLDQHDGIRLLKTDFSASTVLAQAQLGSAGDTAVALALDPSGNVYITGTSTSGKLTATAGTAFPIVSGTSTSFVAKFSSALAPLWLTFTGSDKMATNSIAANATGVYVSGSIFAATLPVTPSAILQSPSFGSLQNGFVEKLNPTGTTLLYATYLTGASGDTFPAALTADSSGNAYILGYTTAPGYPTLNALIPNIIPNTAGATSGFLTKLTPTADGLVFSTFIPGGGLTSIALDPASQTLLLSGNVSFGQFPIATVQSPFLPVPYQTMLRISLDGSTVLSATLLAPGTQTLVAPSTYGTAWVVGDLTTPNLPIAPLSTIGNTYAAHLNAQNLIDQTARLGGLPTSKPTFASAPVTLTSLTADSQGRPTFVGTVTPQASISLIPTESYDLPLFNAPTAALPSSLRDSIPDPITCTLSLCPGSAAYLTRLTNTVQPSLALSTDSAPNLTLRNLGTAQATNLNLIPTNFTLATNCPQTLFSGAECSIALTGAGPGSLTVQAANAATQTISIPAITAIRSGIVFSPKALDFGIQTAISASTTRIITVTNLTTQAQSFTSKQDTTSRNLPYTLIESASDCTLTGPTTKLLAAGATCHITLSLTASAIPANDILLNTQWLIGKNDVLITGYTQAAALNLSASQLDFGTQYLGGVHLPRYLYVSNSSDVPATHTTITTHGPFSIQDRCATQLAPHTVCQLQIDYIPTQTPANDSTTLTLDQNLSAILTAQSLPNPTTSGTSPNPNLTITPATFTFPNAVVVTTPSSTTQTITIGNAGNTSFALSLALSGDFTRTTNCPATLLANTTCTALITFAPSQPGTRQGLLTVTAGASTATNVTLSGTGAPILSTNNGTLDQGSVILGQPTVQWFKVSQPFNNLSVSTTSDFTAVLVEDFGYGHGQPASNTFTSSVSGTCINCWLGIQFKPTATGTRTGTMMLSSSASGNPYTLTLTGVGLPLQGLTLSPITQDFGTIPVRSTSPTAIFTVTNLTSLTGSITLTPPTLIGDFQIVPSTSGSPCAATLIASAACFIEVAFTPTAAGQRTGMLTLTTSFATVTAPLTGYGLPTAALSLSPTSLIFSNVPGPTATLQTITLTNTGTATLQIARPTVSTANFLPTSACTTLAPAATCTVSVAFFPTTANVTDTLQIPATTTLNGNITVTTYTVPLSGTYTAQSASLRITPAQANFGPNPTGSLGGTRQFTITNLTAKSLAVDVTLPRQFLLTGPPCGGLAPNASCSFAVTFLPLTNGDITGTLFAQAKPTDGSATLNAIGYVEGYGTGPGILTVTGPITSGNPLNFGQVPSGQSTTRTLTLTNTSSNTVTVRRITTQWPFLSTTTCGTTLSLNQSCTVSVTYTPTNQQSTAALTPLPTSDAGVLTLESDALSSPNLIDLAGTAGPLLVTTPTNSAPLLSYTASQNSLTFAATPIGNISAPQTVTLANTGTATLHIMSFKADSDFTVASTCATILPAASCDLTVYFTPRTSSLPASSPRIGALQIQSDSRSSLDFVSLLGTATPAFLTFTPTTLDFGTTLLGKSDTLPVQVINTGTTGITFSTLIATGDYTALLGSCPTLGNTLAPSTTCTLQVTFTPTQLGTRTGTVSLDTSATNTALTVSLTGIGAQSHLQIAPTTLDFGTIAIGASANLTFTLTNTGNAPITGITLPTAIGDFSVIAPCALSILVPGSSCNTTVSFTPSAVGPRNASLPVTSSATTSPDFIPLSGVGVLNGSFTFTVDGAATSSATVTSGRPASYTLTLSSINNFAGTVALTCTPIIAADYTTCSLLPSTLILNTGAQNSVATLQTVTSIKPASNTTSQKFTPLSSTILCILTPTLFFFWRRPTNRFTTLWTTFLTAVALATLLSASGCGGGGDSTLRYSTPGIYQYRITASSTSGTQINQSVVLNLTIQPR